MHVNDVISPETALDALIAAQRYSGISAINIHALTTQSAQILPRQTDEVNNPQIAVGRPFTLLTANLIISLQQHDLSQDNQPNAIAAASQQRQDTSPLEAENDSFDGQLSPAERQIITELKLRDREVRAHEQAHKIAAGPYAGPTDIKNERGPDGRQYAVDGEVSFDVTPERDPEASIAKFETIKRAALAPAQPSAKDRAVATEAVAGRLEAEQDLREIRADEVSETQEGDDEEHQAASQTHDAENDNRGTDDPKRPIDDGVQPRLTASTASSVNRPPPNQGFSPGEGLNGPQPVALPADVNPATGPVQPFQPVNIFDLFA